MTRATIAGAAPPPNAKDGGAKRKDEPADAGGDGVLADQFAREFQAIVRQVGDAQSASAAGDNAAFRADSDAQREKRCVAHFGAFAQRLLALVRRLVDRTPELAADDKARVLLLAGDKLAALHEFRAADRFCYSEVVALSAEAETSDGRQRRNKDDVYVRAVFGQATCRVAVARRADTLVRFPGTLQQHLEALQRMQHGMEVAVQLERAAPHQYAWLLLNGSVLVYSVARPLQTLGFEREVIAYFKWCVLCLESTVMLCTTKYILWRLQIYMAVCECLERLATKRPKKAASHLQSALACSEHAVRAVARLRKEEEMDLPLTKAVIATLRDAEAIVNALAVRFRSVAKGEFFGRKVIESLSSLADNRERVRLAVDGLEKSLYSLVEITAASELFEYALELVRPVSQPALNLADSEEIDGSLAQTLDIQFPLSLHIMLIRHACRLKHVEGGDFLLELAHVRSRSMKFANAISSELKLWRVLLDLDRPFKSETADTSDPDRLAFRDRVMSTAEVVKVFVAQVSEALPISLRDLLVSTALRIWKEGATDVLAQLEDSPKPDDLDLDPFLVRKGIVLIEAVYTVLRAVDFEDMVVLGEVCLRLSLLLNQEENRRKSIRTLRDFLVCVNEFRDQVVDDRTHFCASESGHNQQALSRASFSFEMNPRYAQSDCYHTETSPSMFSRRSVGVEGTGSQLGSLHQELACIQVDAMILMFETELEEAAAMDAMEGDAEATTPARSIAVRRSSMLAMTAAALQKEYRKNSYALVLLNIQILRRANKTSQRNTELVEECFKLLSRAEAQERELNKSVDGLPAEVIAPLESSNPRAPRIVKRCASSITVEVIPFKPSNAAARRRTIAYYMVFGKPAGAGTDVSLNNTEYPGTGEPLYAPALRVTVSDLSPNTSYVFATAAFDEQGEVIQGIGETTKTVVALNPLPLVACYGYLAQVCSELKLMQPARRAAMHVYNITVSKEFEDRPGWASNFFYRHALKRSVIARWPISLLDLAVQCIFVLCDAEDGAPLRDGQLTSDGLILRGRQIAVLEASKMVAIGLEIAGAAADFEQIRQLCFKGYRILLPLLHLDDSSALAFAALSTYYQALWCIPLRAWDTDTRSIASRIAFELMRIAWRHHHLTDASFSQVVKVKDCTSDHESPQSATSVSNELAYLLDSITIAECTIGRPLAPSSTDSRPSTAAVTAQPVPGKSTAPATTGVVKAPPAGAAAATPQATPRAVEEVLPPRVSELLSQSKLNVREAFKILEPFIKTSRDSLEVFCKLCHCAIDAGEEGALEEWMPLLTITGALGTKCKETLKSLGLGNLLPEPAPTLAAASSAPNTARSNTKTPRAQEAIAQSVSADTPLTSQTEGTPEPELGNDDEFIYTWCGELSLIEATAQFRKLGRQSAAQVDVNCMQGPRFDCSFAILSGETEKEDTPGANADPPLQNAEVSPSEAPQSSEEHESSVELFRRFVSRMATSCRLFGLARAWQALQTAAQLVANSLWLTWVSPETMGLPEHASTLDDLTVCVDTLLDMIEVVTATLKDEQSGKMDTTLSAGSETSRLLTATHNHTLSLASTTIVVSAMSSLNADQTWIANLIEFVIQSHLVAKRWFKLVQIGKKFHRLSGEGTRFSERMAPVLVYAQQQYLSEQTSRLETAQAELTAFVKAFNDAEAKKKKKKSRLVVEEVLTPEEIEFRAQKAEMDRQIQELAQEQSVRRRELDILEQIHDVVSRTMNKCTQALDSCHHLIEKNRRFGDSAVQQQQIVSAFQYCVALCRQKRQRRLAGKALQELGDFLWEQGDVSAAVKAWNEAVDNAFNALRATTCWRQIIGVHVEEQLSTPDALIEGDGLWTCLESCVTIAKLVLFDSTSGAPTLELARMAAAAFTRIVTKCSLPHPSRSFLYGTQQIFSQVWPGRELLVDTERLEAPRFAMMLSVTAQTLLQYEHPVEAMPLIAAYEYLSTQCFEDLDHATNAHRLRLDVLVQCGRFHEAFEVLAVLLTGIVISRDEKPRQPNALVAKLQFRDDKAIKDPSNSDVLTWLASLDARKVLGDLMTLGCNPTTARLVLVSVVELVVALAQREPIEEEANTTLRQVASKLASSVLTILTEALEHQVLPPQHSEGEQDRKTQNRRADGVVLETLALHHSRAEVLLQQSILATSGGQWVTAQDLCTQCIQVALQSRAVVDEAVKPLGVACISLDTNLPPALVYKASTLVVRARLVSAKVDMALGKYHHVIEQVRTAVDEASSNLEQAHFVRQLELLRVSARVLLGSGSTAIRELSSLRDDFISSHSCESLSYVELLRTLASLVRNQAMQGLESSNSLQRGLMLLEEAEEKLDCVLRRDGWIGADANVSSDKRMSLFQSNVGVFVELKADIAQALMETPLGALEDAGARMHRVLLTIDIALRAANQSIKSIAPTKARLLLQKGVVLKKMLIAKDVPEVRDEDGFRKCVSALEASIEETIRVEVGGHDRHLIRMALMELVDLFGAKLVSGKEAEHLQAAFHYLNLALLVGSYRQTLFDSLELQAGTLTNAEKLPVFVAHAVLESACVTPSAASEPVRANPPPSKGSAPQSSQDGAKRLIVDAPRLVNFFVKVIRERKLLPSCTGLQQDIAVFVHAFLVQNHSTYAKVCCMQSLPAVPAEDPEIKSGVISTHWMHDLSPAFSGAVNSTLSGTMSLYFTLGTVRVEGLDELARSNESVQARVDLFGTSPLLSKRDGFARDDLQEIREQLSRLRIDMEDEDSLVIDRASFQSRFNAILHRIQHILRRQPQTTSVVPRGRDKQLEVSDRTRDGSLGIDIEGDLLDSFNIAIPIDSSLETVKILETMFQVDQGVNNAIDNTLCYFLRDALDS